jgi:hypothetical protein
MTIIDTTEPPYRCRRCDAPIWTLFGLRPHRRYCSRRRDIPCSSRRDLGPIDIATGVAPGISIDFSRLPGAT